MIGIIRRLPDRVRSALRRRLHRCCCCGLPATVTMTTRYDQDVVLYCDGHGLLMAERTADHAGWARFVPSPAELVEPWTSGAR